jgi:epoxyqueuosine reductase
MEDLTMPKNMFDPIRDFAADNGIPIIAVASAERINNTAPAGFRPEDYLPGAKSVIIFAKPLPLSAYEAGNDPYYMFYTRAYSDNYRLMNGVAERMTSELEKSGYPSLPVPAYSPLKFHMGEPFGLISFKHAAAEAGIGKIGKNTLLIHPEHGNILRFGGLMTTLELPAGSPGEFKKICPAACDLCEKACPVGALSGGNINKTKCMTRCIGHPLLPPYPVQSAMRWLCGKSRRMTSFLNYFTISLFENYGIKCMECLLACPHFPGKKRRQNK